jgi:acyl dehydratase/Ni/Co efflux regulator RcnB
MEENANVPIEKVKEEIENYYRNNLETGKLNIHTNKAYYNALDFEKRKVFRNYCLFSRGLKCWVSKGKSENCSHIIAKLKDMGFVQLPPIGEKISLEEQVLREQERAENRVIRFEKRAENAEKKANSFCNTSISMISAIPVGQPIHVGHHSEKADRRYREKADNNMRRSVEESEKAGYYADKAQTAQYTADGLKYKNPDYLDNRIKDAETVIRAYQRYLLGQMRRNMPVQPVSEKAKVHYESVIAEQKERIAFYHKCHKAIDPAWEPKQKNSRKKGKGL